MNGCQERSPAAQRTAEQQSARQGLADRRDGPERTVEHRNAPDVSDHDRLADAESYAVLGED
ncbi:hypothetical protein OG871_06225 [Kitasatospora sp. NBC_00374]|uniref:hypothetical protein n=1 Tax=Kitasatospora sp. NBC_00374 TaxID=2975964 RepID=UPI0032480702